MVFAKKGAIMAIYHIDFEPVGKRGECSSEQSLLDCAHSLGIGLISICGGLGLFGCCKIQILNGNVSPLTSNEKKLLTEEELKNNYRLACQSYSQSDLKVYIPSGSLEAPQRTQVEGQEIYTKIEPVVKDYKVNLSPPSLKIILADAENLINSLKNQYSILCDKVDIDVLRQISPQLRSLKWNVKTSIRKKECISIRSDSSPALGLAIDLGTTKIAGYLVDLETGKTLASKGMMNPQIAFGEDVITRCRRAIQSKEDAKKLQNIVVEAINQISSELTEEIDDNPQDIIDATIVGNTAMHHLLLHLPVKQLVMAPYVAAMLGSLDLKARDMGLSLTPGAYVHLLPNIAGFVGADHVAMLLSTKIQEEKGLVLALDIGTNTEICLSNNGELKSVSTASGPAFEGAHIKHGMRAAPGAIEHIKILDNQIKYNVIGGKNPIGICGSGILDALAQLYLNGIVDSSGRLLENNPRVQTNNSKEQEFILVDANENNGNKQITITQKDIRELQLAKGAIRSGINILLKSFRRSEDEIDKVIIAGAFGSYIDVSSAVIIGMLPPLPYNKFYQVGNAAGMGAKLALISQNERAEAHDIALKTSYIELATVPDFAHVFAKAMYLGKQTI